jgi:cyclophilin family peptidyl-prolyl cis-trans isomerase
MSNKTLALVIAAIVIVAVAVWGAIRIHNNSTIKGTAEAPPANGETAVNSGEQASPTNTQNPVTTADCTRNFDSSKLQTAINTKNQFVTLSVKGYGDIKVQLYDKDAPKTVENFLKLTNAGFYDCLTFHRVAKGFVLQAGDPNGNGSGGQSAFGGDFADELNPNAPSYKTGYVAGVLAMANRGPNTNGSQFFIVLADVNAKLPKAYTIFGKVVLGMDAVQKIGQVDIIPTRPIDPTDGSPKVPVVITKAVISSK